MEELDDDINMADVQRILREIGYDDPAGERGKRLVAYYTSSNGTTPEELEQHLQNYLPAAMIPSYYVELEKFPLSNNGKIDRKALPAPSRRAPQHQGTFHAPQGPVEEALANSWAQVLRLDKVSRHDNFFDLGGDSIANIQVTSLANKSGLKMTPSLMFRHQTIAALATAIGSSKQEKAFDQGEGSVPLLPVQQSYLDKLPEPGHFSQAVTLEVKSTIEAATIEQALTAVVQHHHSLQLRYRKSSSGWQQQYSPAAPGLQYLVNPETTV